MFVKTEGIPGQGGRSVTPRCRRETNEQNRESCRRLAAQLTRMGTRVGMGMNAVSQKNSSPSEVPRAELREKQQMDENPPGREAQTIERFKNRRPHDATPGDPPRERELKTTINIKT